MNQAAAKHPLISIQQLGVWCEGSVKASPTHNIAFPTLLRTPDGSLLLAHRVGALKNSPAGEIWLWRSRDEGVKWDRLPMPSLNPQGKPANFRPVGLSDIGRGRIAMVHTWIDHPDESPLLVNPKTEGLLPVHIGWTTSDDNGSTWSTLREIDVAPLVQPAGNGPMIRLPNNDLLIPFETYKHFDDPSPWASKSAVVVSSDDGATWTVKVVAADPSLQVSYFDPHVYPLRDGSLLNLAWADDRQKPGASEIYYSRSTDLGRTWSAITPTGLHGQFSCVVPLRSGKLLMLYVLRHGDSAICMALGSPDGKTWQTFENPVLYSQRASDLAKADGKDFGDYMQNMGQWSFGWPTMITLRNGELLAAYYAGAGDRSSVYHARIAAAD